MHQTYANILTEELNCNEKALKHRKIAVKLEPKAWTYQGLANTLRDMKRFDEADKAYAKMIEYDPDDAKYWYQWTCNLEEQHKWDEVIEKRKKVLHKHLNIDGLVKKIYFK